MSSGILSPGRVVSRAGCIQCSLSLGHIISGAHYFRGTLSPGQLSPGQLSPGQLSPGPIVLGHIVSRQVVLGHLILKVLFLPVKIISMHAVTCDRDMLVHLNLKIFD